MPPPSAYSRVPEIDPGGYEGGKSENPYSGLYQQVQEAMLDPTNLLQPLSAGLPVAFGRVGVLPGRERIASDIIKRGLKEPWFHGTETPTSLLEGNPHHLDPIQWLAKGGPIIPLPRKISPGFDPSRVGSAHGVRLGEPAGVSLTRDPRVARQFGTPLRVAVDIPPSTVGQFVDPEFQKVLREGYQESLSHPLKSPLTYGVPLGSENLRDFSSIKDILDAYPGTHPGNIVPMMEIPGANQRISDYLRSKGVGAIAYNPLRYNEWEMRVLDPSKAVPLGVVETGSPVVQRFMQGGPGPTEGGLNAWQKMMLDRAPNFPVRLKDVYGSIP